MGETQDTNKAGASNVHGVGQWMQLWGQFLPFFSQSGKSACTIQSKWSEIPLSNVSSVCPSHPLHPPSARSSQTGMHTSYSPTQTQGPLSQFQPTLRSSQSVATCPVLTRRIFNC